MKDNTRKTKFRTDDLLLERLEERILFDAVPVDVALGSEPDAELSPDSGPTVEQTQSVTPQQSVRIVDNGDVDFDANGEWTAWNNQGFQGDVHESLPGVGNDIASWKFDGLAPGRYRVSATWSPFSNRASNAPFSILDGSSVLATAAVDQRVAADDFSDGGATWEDLGGIVQVDSGSLVVQLNDSADGRLNADAIRVERVESDLPDIRVVHEGSEVRDDDGSLDFGTTTVGSSVNFTFTVENLGQQPLNLEEAIVVPDGFVVVSGFEATTLQASESTTFVIGLDAEASGTFSGQVSLTSNDPDENPFDFSVRGTVVDPAAVQIIDNGDVAFETTGEWTAWTNQGFQGDVHESLPGSGTDVASWTFTDLAPGSYRVSATWSPFTNRASDSPFQILDGSTLLATVAVDQRVAADDFTDAGASWEDLGSVYTVESGTLVVQLSDAADGRVNADAIRIERMDRDPVPEPEPEPPVDETDTQNHLPPHGRIISWLAHQLRQQEQEERGIGQQLSMYARRLWNAWEDVDQWDGKDQRNEHHVWDKLSDLAPVIQEERGDWRGELPTEHESRTARRGRW